MGSLPSTNMKDIVIELASRRLYEETAKWYGKTTPTPWIDLQDESRAFFMGLVLVQMPDDAGDLVVTERSSVHNATSVTQSHEPAQGLLRHPMVVWETLILFICSIVIGHLIK